MIRQVLFEVNQNTFYLGQIIPSEVIVADDVLNHLHIFIAHLRVLRQSLRQTDASNEDVVVAFVLPDFSQ